MEINDFIEKLRTIVISISNNVDIVSYEVEDGCVIEIKLISKEENSERIKKQSSRIFRFLKTNRNIHSSSKYDKIKNEGSENFIQIIFEGADKKLVEKVVEKLNKKTIYFKSYFKNTTQYFKKRGHASVQHFNDFVINVSVENFMESVNLIKDEIKKNGSGQIVVTNEKLLSSLSRLVGRQISLQSHGWNSQRESHLHHDNGTYLISITFISSLEKIVVIIDENVNIIDYKVFDIDDPVSVIFSKNAIKSKVING